MKLECYSIANGFEVVFSGGILNEYTKFYKTERQATDAMHRALERHFKKGEF